MRGQTENRHYSLRVKKKEKKKKPRPTRRHFDIFGILSDTLLMCDSEEWMGGKHREEKNVKVMQRMDRGIKEPFKGRAEKSGQNSSTSSL